MAWVVGGVLVLVVALVLTGCRSLDKRELAGRLAALPGNGRLAAALDSVRVPVPWTEDGTEDGAEVELSHARLVQPGAPRMVLVHGAPGTLYNWSAAIEGTDDAPGLADAFDVTAVELAGHGLSDDGLEPLTFQRCADLLAAQLEALDLGPVILVAQSYGGEVAWRLALDRPDLVSRLVLCDSAGQPRADDEWLPEEVALREWPGAGLGWVLNSRERLGRALDPHFPGSASPETFAQELFLTCENSRNWRVMRDLCQDENGERADELSGLSVPTLLVWGAEDLAYPVERFARRFEEAIPGAKLVLLDGLGHYPPQQDPARFAALLTERFADG